MVAVWRYDKRPLNGAPFVYHCTELLPVQHNGTIPGPKKGLGPGPGLASVPASGLGLGPGLGLGLDVPLDDVVLNRVYAFCDMVLTALDVKQGPAHIEVMILPPSSVDSSVYVSGDGDRNTYDDDWRHTDSTGSSGGSSSGCNDSGSSDSSSTSSGSRSGSGSSDSSSGGSIVLIEANCGRWHGQDTVHLCNIAYGYNAPALSIIALLAAWDEKEALHHWLNIPMHPPPPKVRPPSPSEMVIGYHWC